MNMKKFVSLMLALVMVLAMAAVPAFAAESDGDTTGGATGSGGYNITLDSSSNRTFKVYQIFRGTLGGGTETSDPNVLSNVVWGKNGTGKEGDPVADSVLNSLKNLTGTDAEKAAAIKELVDTTSTVFGMITSTSGIEDAPAGYYLLEDDTQNLTDEEAYSVTVVKLVNDTVVTPKAGTVTSDKAVDDKNDSNTSEDSENWKDSADYDIGDKVPFKLTATLPENLDKYKEYKLTFHDRQDATLSLETSSVEVFIGDNTTKLDNTNDKYYKLKTSNLACATDCTFEIHFNDIKKVPGVGNGTQITVKYKSELLTTAVHGQPGNKNDSHVTYSNNPNVWGEGDHEEGKTPKKYCIVFTYRTVVNKVEKNPEWVDGGNNEGKEEFIELKGADFKLSKFVASAEGSTTYKGVTGDWTECEPESAWTENTTRFSFKGLDDGEYKLEETKTPDGYNKIEDKYFTLSAGHMLDNYTGTENALTSLENGDTNTGAVTYLPMNANPANGELTAKVENKKGSVLPETGGIGTTIFYVVGSVLLIGAAVVLITKRRMGAEK